MQNYKIDIAFGNIIFSQGVGEKAFKVKAYWEFLWNKTKHLHDVSETKSKPCQESCCLQWAILSLIPNHLGHSFIILSIVMDGAGKELGKPQGVQERHLAWSNRESRLMPYLRTQQRGI